MYTVCFWLKPNDQIDIAILGKGATRNGTKHADAFQRVLAREAIAMLVKVRENLCSPESCDHGLSGPSIAKRRPCVSVPTRSRLRSRNEAGDNSRHELDCQDPVRLTYEPAAGSLTRDAPRLLRVCITDVFGRPEWSDHRARKGQTVMLDRETPVTAKMKTGSCRRML